MKALNQLPRPSQNHNGLAERKKNINLELNKLDAAQVLAIDRAVDQLGEYGEIHLIVRRGQVRFIGTLRTEAIGTED